MRTRVSFLRWWGSGSYPFLLWIRIRVCSTGTHPFGCIVSVLKCRRLSLIIGTSVKNVDQHLFRIFSWWFRGVSTKAWLASLQIHQRYDIRLVEANFPVEGTASRDLDPVGSETYLLLMSFFLSGSRRPKNIWIQRIPGSGSVSGIPVLIFWGANFGLPESGSADPVGSGSSSEPEPKHWLQLDTWKPTCPVRPYLISSAHKLFSSIPNWMRANTTLVAFARINFKLYPHSRLKFFFREVHTTYLKLNPDPDETLITTCYIADWDGREED